MKNLAHQNFRTNSNLCCLVATAALVSSAHKLKDQDTSYEHQKVHRDCFGHLRGLR